LDVNLAYEHLFRMTSAFDDDELSGNFVNVNDFNDDDDDVMDNWEEFLDEEEEAAKKQKEQEMEQEQKRLEKEKKVAKRLEEKAEQERIQSLMNAKPLTKEEQELAQQKASQAAANDLFGFDDVDETPKAKINSVSEIIKSTAALSINNPDSIDNYIPIEPDDFVELARRVTKKLRNYKDDDGYNKFLRDLISDLCSDMSSEEIKKVSTPLVSLTHEKSRQEKEAKKKAQQTAAKKGVLNMPKKNTEHSDFYLNEYQSQQNYDYDDCDDDFM